MHTRTMTNQIDDVDGVNDTDSTDSIDDTHDTATRLSNTPGRGVRPDAREIVPSAPEAFGRVQV